MTLAVRSMSAASDVAHPEKRPITRKDIVDFMPPNDLRLRSARSVFGACRERVAVLTFPP